MDMVLLDDNEHFEVDPRESRKFTFEGFEKEEEQEDIHDGIIQPERFDFCSSYPNRHPQYYDNKHDNDDIPAVVSDNSMAENELENRPQGYNTRTERRGKPSPGGSIVRIPPPPPPPIQRPSNATPSVAQVSPKRSMSKKVPFVRRHIAAPDIIDEEEVVMAPAKDVVSSQSLLRRLGSEGSDGYAPTREGYTPSLSSSITGAPARNALVLVDPVMNAFNESQNDDQYDEDIESVRRNDSEGSSVELHKDKASCYKTCSLSKLVPEDEIAKDKNKSFMFQRLIRDDNHSKMKLSHRHRSPKSCSITAATSGTVVTSTTGRHDEEISQLTGPSQTMNTPHTQGISSQAETEKVRNLMRRAAKDNKLDEDVEKLDQSGREIRTGQRKAEASATMSVLLRKTNRVKLHVYDLVSKDTQLDVFGCYFPLGRFFNVLNSSLHSLGTGAYHVGVEVSVENLRLIFR
jgi:hypothetical protein